MQNNEQRLENTIDNLVEVVKKAERHPEHGFYRPQQKLDGVRITVTDTISTPGGSRYEEDNCSDCHAAYGHKIFCPKLNRVTAEAIAAFNGRPSVADTIAAHGLGITLN